MEIFHTHYKLNGDEAARVGPLLRLLGASVVAHAALFAAVVYVPAVRDTFALANTLSAFRVVSEDYRKTEVQERAVIINLAAQQLYYPYDLQNPPGSAEDPVLVETVAPTPMPVVRQPRQRRARVTPSPSPSPEASPEVAGNAGEPSASPSPTASPAAPQSVEEAERIAKEAGAEQFPTINTKPFEDLLKEGKRMKEAGEINLEGTLEMTVEADRQDDGVLTNVVITGGAASDEKMKLLAKEFVSALSDSKILAALKGTKHLLMKLKLDDQQVDVRVASDMASAEEASRMASGYNGLLFIGAVSKKGKDEEQIFKSVKVTSEAKQIVLTFNMPRKDAGALVSKLINKNVTPAPTS
ncbi:MAG TPA: hypothetical protein VK421_05520 [Pyrinomonadaceae bacterium]|nr:hypothetical protein [Pyrinomonadaceae bacterium]